MKYIFLIISMCIYIADIASAEYGHIKSKKEQVRDIIFADITQFSHDDLMVFGLTCKDNDYYLRMACDYRKAYILKIFSTNQTVIMNFLRWHRYGSRAEYKKIISDPESIITKKKFMIGRLELADKGTVSEHFGSWTNFESELHYRPVPFYNVAKRLCFFGYGWENVDDYGLCGNILCYDASKTIHYSNAIQRKSHQSAIRCVLHFKKRNGEDGKEVLCRLLEFPILIKSILDSGNYGERKKIRGVGTVAWLENDCCLYDLEKINILDNYKQLVQCHKSQTPHSAFDQLPKELAYAITKRYEDQKSDRQIPHSLNRAPSDS